MKTDKKHIISEELLAAFEEGKTNAEETMRILESIAGDVDMQEEYVLSRRLDAIMGYENEDIDIIPALAMAADSEGNLCDFQCEMFILERRGIEFDASSLPEEAKVNRWLRDKGTPLHSIGRLLEQRDLIVMRRYRAEMKDIVRAINAGHDVIAVVDNNILKGAGEGSNEISYHAVVVTDISDSGVTVYNPAEGDTPVIYSEPVFEEAWVKAKSYMAKVKGKDFDYNPHPVDLEDVELSSDLIDLREAIAENAHEIWADKRQEEGWTYGKFRDDEKKLNPDMVPYSLLPESEKEYDRRMAMDTIKLMKKLGYDIVRHRDTPAHKELMRKINNEDWAGVCKCGADIFPDQKYCPQCGRKLEWKDFL